MNNLFFLAVTGIGLFIAVVNVLQYFINNDKAYLFYAVYIGISSVNTYQLATIDLQHFAAIPTTWAFTFVQRLAIISYLAFSVAFFRNDKVNESIMKIWTKITLFFVFLCGIEVIIYAFDGNQAFLWQTQHYFTILRFALSFICIYHVRFVKSPLRSFYLLGTAFLWIGVLVGKAFPPTLAQPNVLYLNPYFYHVVFFLLENICLTIGLSDSVGMSNTFIWTGASSSSWAAEGNWAADCAPSSTDNVIIQGAYEMPTLSAHQTVKNMTLKGRNNVILGDFDLTVQSLTGGDTSNYVVTNGQGKLKIPVAAGATQLFPIGVSTTSYEPVTLKPTNATTFSAKVDAMVGASSFAGRIEDFSRVAPRQWNITPTINPDTTVVSLTYKGTFNTLSRPPVVGHYNNNAFNWEEIPATQNLNTWTAKTTGFSPFGVGTVSSFRFDLIPVELIDFQGQNTEGGNLLTWRTASEVNTKGFYVERQKETKEWEALSFTAANLKGSTYKSIDKTPLSGINYYRLKMVDNDEKTQYSKIIALEKATILRGIKVYPSPATTVLYLDNAEGKTVDIINAYGQLILSIKNTQQSAIPIQQLPSGVYMVRVGLDVAKFVKP